METCTLAQVIIAYTHLHPTENCKWSFERRSVSSSRQSGQMVQSTSVPETKSCMPSILMET